MMPDARQVALVAFFDRFAPLRKIEAKNDLLHLLPVSSSGYELILSAGATELGVLLKGQGEEFLHGILAIVASHHAPMSLGASILSLAAFAHHRNGYCKIEWAANWSSRKKISAYYRCRQDIYSTILFLRQHNIAVTVCQQIELLAALFQTENIHFLAVSAEQGQAQVWKVYFSQWVTAESYGIVLRRLLSALEICNVNTIAAGQLAALHAQFMPLGKDRTLFISCSFTENELFSTVKVDYEEVNVGAVSRLPLSDVGMDDLGNIRWMLANTQRENLSYLGIRLDSTPHIHLKYYADNPAF